VTIDLFHFVVAGPCKFKRSPKSVGRAGDATEDELAAGLAEKDVRGSIMSAS
jgi:hypothetical protein